MASARLVQPGWMGVDSLPLKFVPELATVEAQLPNSPPLSPHGLDGAVIGCDSFLDYSSWH